MAGMYTNINNGIETDSVGINLQRDKQVLRLTYKIHLFLDSDSAQRYSRVILFFATRILQKNACDASGYFHKPNIHVFYTGLCE